MFTRRLVTTLAIGGTVGLLLVMASAWSSGSTALADTGDGEWPVWIEGRPLSLEPGSAPGFYFWHDEEGLHLFTTTPWEQERTFTAILTTDGHFRDLDQTRFEPADDAAIIDGGRRLIVRLHTYDGIDGVSFRIAGGDRLTLRLYVEGHPIDPAFIFAGRHSVHPNDNPVTAHR